MSVVIKIRNHEDYILNRIESKISNAKTEYVNSKIKLFIHKCGGLETSRICYTPILDVQSLLYRFKKKRYLEEISLLQTMTLLFFQFLPAVTRKDPFIY